MPVRVCGTAHSQPPAVCICPHRTAVLTLPQAADHGTAHIYECSDVLHNQILSARFQTGNLKMGINARLKTDGYSVTGAVCVAFKKITDTRRPYR